MTRDREKLQSILTHRKDYGFTMSDLRGKIISDLIYFGKVYVGGRNKNKSDKRVRDVVNILKENEISFEEGNDAPWGGMEGDYIKLTSKALEAEIAKEQKALLKQFRAVQLETWHREMCDNVTKDWGDKTFDYLKRMIRGEIKLTKAEMRYRPSNFEKTQTIIKAAERNQIKCDAAFIAALDWYYVVLDRIKRDKEGIWIPRFKSEKDFDQYILPNNGLLPALREKLEIEGILPIRPVR